MSLQFFSSLFTPFARFISRTFRWFENLVEPFKDHAIETPPAEFIPYVVSQLRPIRRVLLWIVLFSVLVAVAEVGLIMYSGRLVDLMAEAGPALFWQRHALEVVLVALLVLLARPILFTVHHMLLEQTLVSNLQDQVRWRAHRHLLGQSMNFFQNDFAGRLTNRVMQQGPAVEDWSYMLFEAIWFAAVYSIGSVVVVAGFNLWLVVPLVIWLVAFIAYSWLLALRVASASEKASDGRSLVTGRVVDAYANIESVKLFAKPEQEERYVLSALKRHRLRFQRWLRLMTELHAVQSIMNGLLIVSVMTLSIWMWVDGRLTIGEVAAASALVIRLNGMSGWIMWVIIRMFEHVGTIREGLRSLSKPHDVVDVDGASTLAVTQGRISVRNVSHHYGKLSGGLDNLTLDILPGQRVGLVGRSGAGKSSLVNLLLRFSDAEQGQILIDGQDISQVTQNSLRQAIGMVTQDSSLLHRSIRANLMYGNPQASQQDMIEAAKQAFAHDFIVGLTDQRGRNGYDAFVGERGVKLSGGQRQRVALARVILKDAPILVLDEATSALDSEVEAMIQESLYRLMEGKTVIAIAHRLSTIARMDRILVMDQGRIVEDGNHEELLSLNGLYASLWRRQSGGFIGKDAAE